jgi:hypothetical protein
MTLVLVVDIPVITASVAFLPLSNGWIVYQVTAPGQQAKKLSFNKVYKKWLGKLTSIASFQVIVSMIYWSDVAINCRTAYYEDGTTIDDPKKVAGDSCQSRMHDLC